MATFGLIGFPLNHSFSRSYFDEKFRKERLPHTFQLFSISDITQITEVLKLDDLKGLAVTIPYKKQVIQYLDSIDISVSQTGACNCIAISDTLIGYNTDIIGFENSFVKGLKPFHSAALILGTGGAAMAACYVLDKLHIPYRTVSRDPHKANLTYKEISSEIIQQFPVIINCTPAGMFPNPDTFPDIPYKALNARNYLFDMVYNPEETLFIKKGNDQGAQVKNGMEMLIIQAEENWKIWKNI